MYFFSDPCVVIDYVPTLSIKLLGSRYLNNCNIFYSVNMYMVFKYLIVFHSYVNVKIICRYGVGQFIILF